MGPLRLMTTDNDRGDPEYDPRKLIVSQAFMSSGAASAAPASERSSDAVIVPFSRRPRI